MSNFYDKLFLVVMGGISIILIGTLLIIFLSIPKMVKYNDKFTKSCVEQQGQVIYPKGKMICIKKAAILEVK